jgi:phosphate transport system protein
MTHDEHILKRFDNEMEEIRAHILNMGGLVEIQLKLALHALFEANIYLSRQVIDQDQQVNRMEVEIDGLCCSAIARHQPAASDLRLIVNATKIIMHLERIGDEAKKIAGITERRGQPYRLLTPRTMKIYHVTGLTQNMLQDVLHSFARQDLLSARKISEQHDLLKTEFISVFHHLIESMTINPHTISSSLETLFIVKAVERIGDHITFISELVINSSNRYYDKEYQPKHNNNITDSSNYPAGSQGGEQAVLPR